MNKTKRGGPEMPVRKVGNKYAIGSGKPIYKTKASAEKAYKGYLGAKHSKGARRQK